MIEIKQQIQFGSAAKDIDELAQKVLSGEKTATSSLLDYYRKGLKEISSVDDYMSVLDSFGNPVAIIRVIKTEIKRFGDISESFAIEEGDGNLAQWKAIHHPYYSKLLSDINEELTNDTELVCEWFQLISVFP